MKSIRQPFLQSFAFGIKGSRGNYSNAGKSDRNGFVFYPMACIALSKNTRDRKISTACPYLSGFATKETVTVSQDREPPAIVLDSPPPTVTATEWLPLRGRAAGATGLWINGQPVQLIGEEFDRTVTLTSGRNTIELIAVDLVGNRRVDRFDVQLDQDPPRLVGYEVTPTQAQGGDSVRVEVRASDPSGLRKAAAFRIRVGDTDYADFLELGGDSGTYRKTVRLPGTASGRISLREVEIEDYAGNKARFTFDR